MYVRTYVCVYVCMYVYICCTYAALCMCARAVRALCVYVYMYVCEQAFMYYVCTCVCTYVRRSLSFEDGTFCACD